MHTETPEEYSLDIKRWVDIPSLLVDLQQRSGFLLESSAQERFLSNLSADANTATPFVARQIGASFEHVPSSNRLS
jgi:hypothetical protein